MANNFDAWLEDAERSVSKQDLAPHRQAIGQVESELDYGAIGPQVSKGRYAGDRAYGKYQVMGKNIPEWGKEALGRPVSVKEFVNSPEIQDKIFDHKFGQLLEKHSPADAASIWFSGSPLREAMARRAQDDLGTTAPKYVKNYLTALGQTSEPLRGAVTTLEDLDKEFTQGPLAASTPVDSVETQPELPAQAGWGFGQNIMSEALLGAGPKVSAAAQAGREALRDVMSGTPIGNALQLAQNVYYPQALSAYKGAAEGWGEENPGQAVASSILGQTAPIMAGIGAANVGLRGVAQAVPRLAPAVQFVGGLGTRSGGLPTTLASGATAGAWQGALGNQIVGQDPTMGAMIGAPLGAVTNPLIRAVTAPWRATMRPEVAQAAKEYIDRGGTLQAPPFVQGKELASTLRGLSGPGETALVEDFNRQLAQTIGAEDILDASLGKGLTSSVMDAAKTRLDAIFNDFGENAVLQLDPAGIRGIRDAYATARTKLGKVSPEAVGELKELVKHIGDVIAGRGEMTGREFLTLTNAGGKIDDLYKHKPLTPYLNDIKNALDGMLERTDSNAASQIKEARTQWNNLRKLQKVPRTDVTGLLTPKAVARKFKEDSDLGHIARIGEFLPDLDAAGNVKTPAPSRYAQAGGRVLQKLGPFATGLGGVALGAGAWPTVSAYPGTAAAVALGSGLGFLGKEALGSYFASPQYMQRVLQNTLQNRLPLGIVNPLIAGVPLLSNRGE